MHQPYSSTTMGINVLRTQKARGIFHLVHPTGSNTGQMSNMGLCLLDNMHVWFFPHYVPVKDDQFPLFARPCPVEPTHGGEPSKLIHDMGELMQMANKIWADDPQSEIILMPALTGVCSFVLTPAGISWGLGNDGATVNNSTFIPIEANEVNFNKYLGPYSPSEIGLGADNWLFVEAVEHEGDMRMVQLRTGPKLPSSSNFIPKRTKVKKIVQVPAGLAYDDLGGWEKHLQVVMNEDTDGAVVWLPGQSLSSHYAIHAVSHGLPVITDKPKPHLAWFIDPSDNDYVDVNASSAKSLARLTAFWAAALPEIVNKPLEPGKFQLGSPYNYTWHGHAVRLAFGALHGSTKWSYDNDTLNSLRAFTVMAAVRFVLSACIAEARHFYGSSGPGRTTTSLGSVSPSDRRRMRTQADFDDAVKVVTAASPNKCRRPHTLPWSVTMSSTDTARMTAKGTSFMSKREDVYNEFECVNIPTLWELGVRAFIDLAPPGWGGSFGGHKWANSAIQALILMQKVDKFVRHPTPALWKEVWRHVNTTLSVVHNGGLVVSKWVSSGDLTLIADNPWMGFLSTFTSDALRFNLRFPLPESKDGSLDPYDYLYLAMLEDGHTPLPDVGNGWREWMPGGLHSVLPAPVDDYDPDAGLSGDEGEGG